VNATEKYISILARLKPGDLGLLRTHAGQGVDETVGGFDLFAGLWWPLRQENQRAPRREVAWLVAKLYAGFRVEHQCGAELALRLGCCRPAEDRAAVAHRKRFDQLLTLPLAKMEHQLRWALGQVASRNLSLDWVQLTDDLSIWEREATRLRWAEQYLGKYERS
jgi:CRISPR type I-E-associated protein CasB/Cse2